MWTLCRQVSWSLPRAIKVGIGICCRYSDWKRFSLVSMYSACCVDTEKKHLLHDNLRQILWADVLRYLGPSMFSPHLDSVLSTQELLHG